MTTYLLILNTVLPLVDNKKNRVLCFDHFRIGPVRLSVFSKYHLNLYKYSVILVFFFFFVISVSKHGFILRYACSNKT